MKSITYTSAKRSLSKAMNDACAGSGPVIIRRRGAPDVVLVSLDEYAEQDATAWLLRSPANAARLKESLAQVNAGKVVEVKMGKDGFFIPKKRSTTAH